MNKKILLVCLLCILFLWGVLATTGLFLTIKKAGDAGRQSLANAKIISFADTFIKEILMSQKDVDFDTRLMLETSVRNLNDPEIFAKWQDFTMSKTGQDAGNKAKELLSLLIKKISF